MHARQVSGVRRYTETDAGIVGAAAQLAQLGLRPKNLRVVKSAVDREIGLIEQVLLPALKSNRQERRREGLEPVSYTHLRAHETRHDLVCRLLLEKKKKTKKP